MLLSRVTKYLHQHCMFETALTNRDGTPKLNNFGERQYARPVNVLCREEVLNKQVATAEGVLITSVSRFYLEPTLQVKVEDRINGHTILSVAKLINSCGKNEGYECYV